MKILLRNKRIAQLIDIGHIIFLTDLPQHILEHGCQFLNIFLLLLHIAVIRYILGQLLTFLRREFQLRCAQHTLSDCEVTVRETFHLLRNRPVEVLRLFLNNDRVVLVHLKRHQILHISAKSRTRKPAENLPCICQRHLTLTLSVSRRHHDRLHIGRLNLLLIAVQPACIQKLLHVAADSEPLDRGRKNNTVRLFHRLRQGRYFILVLIDIDPLDHHTQFAQHFFHLIQNIKCRIVQQSPSTVINIYFHSKPPFCPICRFMEHTAFSI